MRFIPSAALVLAFAAAAACSDTLTANDTAAPGPTLNWGPAPAIFPAGAQMAVMQGDPSGNALFTIRLKLPDGYKIPPHTHPTDENVTVVSGAFRVGMGTTFDLATASKLDAGGFVVAPANGAHFAAAQGETIVQVHAMGPFAMTYVNPADAPSAGK
ncbi:MAG: cupin domain-containing protein [bacterium]